MWYLKNIPEPPPGCLQLYDQHAVELPFVLGARAIGPALAMGNAVILKPDVHLCRREQCVRSIATRASLIGVGIK
jgi:hypothetical protein